MTTIETQIAEIFAKGNQENYFSYENHDRVSDGYWEAAGTEDRPSEKFIFDWVKSTLEAEPQNYIGLIYEFNKEAGIELLETFGEKEEDIDESGDSVFVYSCLGNKFEA